jgi:hypothetical protein
VMKSKLQMPLKGGVIVPWPSETFLTSQRLHTGTSKGSLSLKLFELEVSGKRTTQKEVPQKSLPWSFQLGFLEISGPKKSSVSSSTLCC